MMEAERRFETEPSFREQGEEMSKVFICEVYERKGLKLDEVECLMVRHAMCLAIVYMERLAR